MFSGNTKNIFRKRKQIESIKSSQVKNIKSKLWRIDAKVFLQTPQVMSLLRSFKESLKPCSNFPSNFSQSSSVSQESSNDTLIIPRRPPKSSLAQQLQRLGETYNFSLPQQNPETRREKAPVEKSHVFYDEQEKFGRHQLGQFQFDHTGPFEPLVLSKDGEFPIIQVSNFYFFFKKNSCNDYTTIFWANWIFNLFRFVAVRVWVFENMLSGVLLKVWKFVWLFFRFRHRSTVGCLNIKGREWSSCTNYTKTNMEVFLVMTCEYICYIDHTLSLIFDWSNGCG